MKLSIITINWNNAAGLEKTIMSVASQSTCEFEYIIVDGGSTDSSVDVIRKYEDKFTSLTWVSEKDKGIYNAMNKGIKMASGDYLLFINSGDCLYPSFSLRSFVEGEHGEDFILGRVNIVLDGRIADTTRILKEEELSLFNMYLFGIPHQAAFIKRSLFDDCPYDESLRINSDWKFFLQKIVLGNATVRAIEDIIADYDGSGISSTQMDLLQSERQKIIEELIPGRIASDYNSVFPHYYETVRIKWLLEHRMFYRLYRMMTALGMRLLKS